MVNYKKIVSTCLVFAYYCILRLSAANIWFMDFKKWLHIFHKCSFHAVCKGWLGIYFMPGNIWAKLNKCTRSLGGVDGKGRPYVILLQHVSLEEPEPLAIPSIALACSCSLRLEHEEDKSPLPPPPPPGPGSQQQLALFLTNTCKGHRGLQLPPVSRASCSTPDACV